MKTLSVMLTLLCLWGCGPEQSSAQKDEAQNKEISQQQTRLYKPFDGKMYRGTLTKSSGGVADVTLKFTYSETQVSNPSRLEMTTIPSLSGAFRICLLQTPCFATDVNNPDGSQELPLTSANRSITNGHLVLYIAGSCPSGGCNGVSSATSTSQNLDLVPSGPNNSTLTGTYSDANGVYNVTLTQVNQ